MSKATPAGRPPRRARRQLPSPLIGPWRITEMDLWELDDLDLLGPAQITLEEGGRGRLSFIAVDVVLEYQFAGRDCRGGIEFTFEGSDEGDRVSGRGWAVLEGRTLRGRIHFHRGDNSGFVARQLSTQTTRSSRRTSMKPTRGLARLERRLAGDRTAILSASDVEVLDRELKRAMAESFQGLPAQALDRSQDVIRWQALGARCKEARRARGIRDMSVITGIPQYRLRAIESGHLSEIRPDLAHRYFRILGIEDWVTRWYRANRELAARAGLLDAERPVQSTAKRAVGQRAKRRDGQ